MCAAAAPPSATAGHPAAGRSVPRRRRVPALPLLFALLALAACATRPPADDPEAVAEFEGNNDPIEPWNRAMFQVHEGIDTVLLRPAAEIYRVFVPPPVRTGVRNVLGNLRSPVILLNDALQGETDRFGVTLGRFLLNSTLGVVGIFDVAADHFNLPGHTEDFGQTLAVWGAREGAYLFVPVLGPSSVRDLGGFAVDIASNPITWISGDPWEALGYVRTGLTVVDTREAVIEPIDQVRQTSLDPYATFRSAYRQLRLREITNSGLRPAPPAAFGTGLGVGIGAQPAAEPPAQPPAAAPAQPPARAPAQRPPSPRARPPAGARAR